MLGKIFGFFTSVIEPIVYSNVFKNKRPRDSIIEEEINCPVPVKKRKVLQEIPAEWKRTSSHVENTPEKHDPEEILFRTPAMQAYFSVRENKNPYGLKFEKSSPYKKSCKPPNHCKSPEKKIRRMGSPEDSTLKMQANLSRNVASGKNSSVLPIERVDLTKEKKPVPGFSKKLTFPTKNKHVMTFFKTPRSLGSTSTLQGGRMSHMEYSQVLGSFMKHSLSKPKSPQLPPPSAPVDYVDLSREDDDSLEIVSDFKKLPSRNRKTTDGIVDLTSTPLDRTKKVSKLDSSCQIVADAFSLPIQEMRPDRRSLSKTDFIDLTGLDKENERLIRSYTSSVVPVEVSDSAKSEEEGIEVLYSKRIENINTFDRKIVKKNKHSSEEWVTSLNKEYKQKMEQLGASVNTQLEVKNGASEDNMAFLQDWVLKRIHRHCRITEYVIPVEEEEEATEFPELTPEMKKKIMIALREQPADEILVKGFGLEIRRRDMSTLGGLTWLNDEVINFYMNLIMERGKQKDYPSVYAFSTFFYPRVERDGHNGVKRWTKRVDLFEYELILVPVHLKMHWCMAVIDLKNLAIKYYDSMGHQNEVCLRQLQQYIIEEKKVKKGSTWKPEEWKLESVRGIPQQNNGSDCGVFACTFAEFSARHAAFTFSQQDMPYLRQKMVYEILTSELLL